MCNFFYSMLNTPSLLPLQYVYHIQNLNFSAKERILDAGLDKKETFFLSHVPFEYLSCLLNALYHVQCGPVPQDAGAPLLLLLQIFSLSIISIAVLENVNPTQGYRKEPSFPH
jgi:hypothetical protein